MSFLTRRQTAVECFFCLSSSLLSASQDRDHWRCERCGCLNARDRNGEIQSAHPAMRDPELNRHSFALRAAPSTSRLPSQSPTSPFCQSCLTNQTLITNLLANYLPDDSDPSYPTLYGNLDSYVSSLHSRYPPVCARCQPAVDAALKKSDYRAQAGAWGGLLRRSEHRTAVQDDTVSQREDTLGQVTLWFVRGVLFRVGCLASWAVGALSLVRSDKLAGVVRDFAWIPPSLLFFNLASIAWIAWDPYWLKRVRSGGRLKVIGRDLWVSNMFVIWAFRVASSSMLLLDGQSLTLRLIQVAAILELLVFVTSLATLRLKVPLPVRLIRSKPDLKTQPPAQPAPCFPTPALSTSSLSSHPASSQHNPIFGRPTIPSSVLPETESEAEPMEWEPDPSAVLANGGWTGPGAPVPDRSSWDTFGAGRQRMFPRSEEDSGETGLESLLEGWGIGGGGTVHQPVKEARPVQVASSDRAFAISWSALLALRSCATASQLLPTASRPPFLFGAAQSPWLASLETGLAIISLLHLALSPPSASLHRDRRVAAFCASAFAHLICLLSIDHPYHHFALALPILADIGQLLAWQ